MNKQKPLLDIIETALIAAQTQTPYDGKLNDMAHDAYNDALEAVQQIRDGVPNDLEKALIWRKHHKENPYFAKRIGYQCVNHPGNVLSIFTGAASHLARIVGVE